MKYDAFDYFTIDLETNGFGPIPLKTEPGRSKSIIITDGNTASIDVDYAHRPVFIIRSNKKITITNMQRVVKSATHGMKPNIELVKRYVQRGRSLASCVPYHGVECIAPSNRIIIANNKISTEKYQSAPPGEPLSGTEAIEQAIVESLAERLKNRKCAFAFSGGTDSTLLAALAKRHQICDVTAYTAKTGAGRDLTFARAAAQSLGIKLIEVEIPVTRHQLEIHRALTETSCGPVRPKVGFTMICAAAAADGFDEIVEGTGPAPIFGGNDKTHGAIWAAEQLRLGNRERAEKFIDFALSHSLIDRRTVAEIKTLAEQEISFRDYMFDRLIKGRVYQHIRCASGAMAGIEVVMPFFDHVLGHYLLNDGGCFFENGRNKSALRKILAKYVPNEIAYRTDNQGLRWPTKRLINTLGNEMHKTIRNSEIFNQLGGSDRLKIALKFDRGFFTRSYAAAIFLGMRAENG